MQEQSENRKWWKPEFDNRGSLKRFEHPRPVWEFIWRLLGWAVIAQVISSFVLWISGSSWSSGAVGSLIFLTAAWFAAIRLSREFREHRTGRLGR